MCSNPCESEVTCFLPESNRGPYGLLISWVLRSPPLSYGDGWITENPLGPSWIWSSSQDYEVLVLLLNPVGIFISSWPISSDSKICIGGVPVTKSFSGGVALKYFYMIHRVGRPRTAPKSFWVQVFHCCSVKQPGAGGVVWKAIKIGMYFSYF